MGVDLVRALEVRGRKPASGVKHQPEWIDAAFDSFANKRSNIQMEFGVWMKYERCPEIGTRRALDMIVEAWVSCKPLLDVLLK